MSSVSTSRAKKSNPLDKKIPENPKYKNVKCTVDTGASVTKYMEKVEDIRNNYNFKNDEVFKRMKVTTFVQLVVQVADYEHDHNSEENGSYRPDTADEEVDRIQRGQGDRSPAPSRAMTETDYGAPATNNNRSTLQGVIKGEGELDKHQRSQVERKVLDGCPYLLLDMRDKDCYESCHIVTAISYPSSMLSRSVNYETKEMLAFKNMPGKIIVVYDENEALSPKWCTTLVQRGYDNIFLLSGGMKVAYKIFPEGLFTGTPPQTVMETPRASTRMEKASMTNNFTEEDLAKISFYLDHALTDKSSGSRLSKASTASSRMSNVGTSRSSKVPSSVQSGRMSHQAPFKP